MAEAAPAADPPEGSAAAAVDPEVDSQWVLGAKKSIAVARGARYNPKIKLVAPLARYFMET